MSDKVSLKTDENIHAGHRERMREKFLRGGLDVLADHEALELLLYYAIKRSDTNPLAHKLIREFGSLHALCEARPEIIAQKCNLSINTAVLISLVLPISRRCELSKWGKTPDLSDSKECSEYVKSLFLGETVEVLYMLCMDSKNKLIHPVEIARGTINKAPIYPRIVLEKVIQHGATAVVLTHNHPAGSLTPSASDVKITNFIRQLLEKIDVALIDHFIVGGNKILSFAEKKLLNI
ncbi:MAG: DNA repair protein RadC [Defluviitaleaceae bacterium]|nr:DNA repair protein RadC [Defluviitaleaceae bacterium]